MGLASGHVVTANEFNAATRSNGVDFKASGTATLATTSATFVNISGGSTSFTKLLGSAASDVIVKISLSAFSTAIATLTEIGVNVNGVDLPAMPFTISAASAHAAFPLGEATFTGLAAGTYTVQARARRTGGGGTVSMASENYLYMEIYEKLK